jgi:hypothetical protein
MWGDDRRTVLNRLVRASTPPGYEVTPDAYAYCDEVVVRDPEWSTGVSAGRINVPQVQQIFSEGLDAAAARAATLGTRRINRPVAEYGLTNVVQRKYRCPYPFLIC